MGAGRQQAGRPEGHPVPHALPAEARSGQGCLAGSLPRLLCCLLSRGQELKPDEQSGLNPGL